VETVKEKNGEEERKNRENEWRKKKFTSS
jgi:hypothetical protein